MTRTTDTRGGVPSVRCGLVWIAVGALALTTGAVGLAGTEEAPAVTSVTVIDRPATTSETISIDVENVPLAKVVTYIAAQTGHNILVDKDVDVTVTQRLMDVNWRRALQILLEGTGCYLEEESANIFRISKPETISGMGEEDIRTVVNMIAKAGGANVVIAPDVKGPVSYNFKDVTWKEALDTVVKAAGFVAVREGATIRIVSPGALKAQLETRIFQMKYIRPPSIYTAKIKTAYAEGAPTAVTVDESTGVPKTFTLYHALKKALSDRGRLEYHIESNSFLITDTTPVLDQIQRIIERIDVEPLQVFVDVRFVTRTGDDDLDFGVDWAKGLTATLTPGSMATRIPFSRETGRFIEDAFGLTGKGFSPADVAAFLGGSSPFSFGTLSFAAATSVLNVLKNDENTTVRQAPRLMVLNHQPGTVFVGSSIRFAEIFSSSSQGGTLATGVREADNSPVNTGFQLLVIPHIVRGTKDILMTVIPESNTLTEFKEFGTAPNAIELPQIASSTVVTQMLIRDGQTAVIGGLVIDREEDQVRKVPFLGDIPGLGYIFKVKKRNRAKEHMMIFITPRIVRTAKDSQAVFVSQSKHDWPEADAAAEPEEKAAADTGETEK